MAVKKRLVQIDETYVDGKSGEVLGQGHLVWFAEKEKAPGGWFMLYQEALERLVTDKDITFDPTRVLIYMFAHVDYENHIWLSQAEIADALGMKRPNVSKAIKLLLEKEIIALGRKVGRSHTYRLNPDFGWKGKVKNLKEYRKKKAEENELLKV